MTFQWIKVTLVVSSWIRLFERELNDRHLGEKAKVEGKLDQLLFYLISMGTSKWNVTESTEPSNAINTTFGIVDWELWNVKLRDWNFQFVNFKLVSIKL